MEPSRTKRGALPYVLEQVEQVTEHYPATVRDEVLWLFKHGKRNEFSTSDLGEAIERDATTVSKLFTGQYAVQDWQPLLESISEYRANVSIRDLAKAKNFIMTSAAELMFELFEMAMADHGIVMIVGDSQTGKSTICEAFQILHPDREIIYTSIPAGASLAAFRSSVATACCLNPRSNTYNVTRRIKRRITRNHLLIVDEFDLCFSRKNSAMKDSIVEFIREIWNECRCGIALIITGEAYQTITTESLPSLVKLRKRSIEEIYVNPPNLNDLNLFGKHYGYPPLRTTDFAHKHVTALVEKYSLERFVGRLYRGRQIAESQGRKPTWTDWMTVHDTFAKQPKVPAKLAA